MSGTKSITVDTDGAAIKNPGPCGDGAVLLSGQRRMELNGGFRKTTNNRMELMAAIKALEALKPLTVKYDITLYSDSEYVVKGFTEGRVERWRARGWKLKGGEKVMNLDLWKLLVPLVENQEVKFKWVKGHSGIPENERADKLAMEAAKAAKAARLLDRPIDKPYEYERYRTTALLIK